MTREKMVKPMRTVHATALEDRESCLASVAHLLRIALGNTGQSRRVADFLLAWHNAQENGGWDPTDLWNVDVAIADDILIALHLLRRENRYPGDLGFQKEIDQIWERWRAGKHNRESESSDSDANESERR